MSKPEGDWYLFDRYRLNIVSKEFLYEDHPIHLNRTQFEILRILVENHGEFVKKDKLVNDVFGNSSVGPNTIEQAIYDLRGKLHDAAGESRFIETGRRMGYRFVANLRRVSGEDLDQDSNPALEAQAEEERPALAPHAEENVAVRSAGGGTITFRDWIRGPDKSVKLVLVACVILTVAISTAGITSEWAKPFVSTAQFFVILIAFVPFLREPKGFRRQGPFEDDRFSEEIRKATGYDDAREWNEAQEIAQTALEQYTRCWQFLLVSWLVLYGFLAFLGSASPALSIATTLFNNCNTLIIALCFNILNKPMVITAGDRNKDNLLIVGLVVLLAFTFIEILLVFRQNYIQTDRILEGADLVSGIAGGIAMALYVGRLQSKFLGPPPWLLIALYSYTAIQPLYVFFNNRQLWPVILIDVALILKCLLFLYMAWLFQSGRLLFYLVQVRRTYQKVETDWQEFRKVLD
ncbi:MAG TPA: winged helix-turn-helix domain-containing protein [Pyrinomonadaceae bacterium]